MTRVETVQAGFAAEALITDRMNLIRHHPSFDQIDMAEAWGSLRSARSHILRTLIATCYHPDKLDGGLCEGCLYKIQEMR